MPVSSALAAEFSIAPNGFNVEILDSEGHPDDLAGSHPDRLRIDFALEVEGTTARDLEFDLPPGFAGGASAVPFCPRSVYEANEECPPESQVGSVEFKLSSGTKVKLPLFQLEPAADQLIAFGSRPSFDLPLATEVRPDDFGITFKANDLPKESIVEGSFELWGVPADHQVGTGIPRRPLLSLPSTCGPIAFAFHTRSWEEGAPWLSAGAEAGPLVGCEGLNFGPALGMQLSDPLADSLTGMRIDLNVPGEAEGSERADAQIDNVRVALPSGIGVSPSGAEGLVACSDAQLGLGTSAVPQCPPGSRLGTAEFSVLGRSLTGTIYLGQEHPGQRFRVFLVASGPGAVFKSVGALLVDPVTGRLSTVLEHLPQIPVERISLIFDGGPTALLAAPLSCGPTSTLARFEPYGGGPAVDSTATVSIASRSNGGRCTGPPPFSPQLTTATSSHRAGQPTTFSAIIRRQPGEQAPRAFSTALPAGMSAKLGGVPACSAADAAAASCPPASSIGSVTAEVGSGPSPAALHGSVYMTDSYRRAPFGLLIAFRAAIGPFDLGTIAMRGTADIDRRTGRPTISVIGIPEQIEGVPIRFRSIELNMDRPGFVLNPTSCAPKRTEASLESQSGELVAVSSPLELGGCNRLGFKPAIQMKLSGGSRELRKHGHPGVNLSLRARRGDTALRGMTFSLPSALGFEVGGLREICSRLDAARGNCPVASQVGSARARTSLLSMPLSGTAYIAQPEGNGPPDIWVSLAAMGVHVYMKSETRLRHGHFVTKLAGLPDMPLSELTMRLGGNTRQVFTLRVDPCRKGHPRRLVSSMTLEGQNGARRALHPQIGNPARCNGSAPLRARRHGAFAAPREE